jgi:hypothetical protein
MAERVGVLRIGEQIPLDIKVLILADPACIAITTRPTRLRRFEVTISKNTPFALNRVPPTRIPHTGASFDTEILEEPGFSR